MQSPERACSALSLASRGLSSAATQHLTQASLRFGDARVVLEDILHLDSDKNVPSMLSRHDRTTLFTDDFWNVRHICTTADSNGRVSVVARVARPGIALFPSASLTTPGSRTTVREVFQQVRSEPAAQARPVSAEFPVVVFLAGGNKTRLCQA